MSALGQKQTLDWRPLMSALPPKADIDGDSLLLLASTGDPLRQGFPVRVVLRGKLPAAGVEGIAARLGSEWL